MDRESKARDTSDIFTKVVIPLVIVVLGILGNLQIAQLNNRLATETRDVDIIQRFSSIYYYEGNQDSRRLSIYYIRLIDNPQMRLELRQFIIWDTLERNITSGFKFDQELGDWHMVGDTIFDMAEDDPERAKIFWCDLKSTTLERWSSQETELVKLYDWLESVYQRADANWANCS